ncbi:MAG TPA: hypothetical protein VF173_23175 [Thermoanaerobaculia bacterium]|nr:hypothetical protein [Thermoanaerobaculia bacterium]
MTRDEYERRMRHLEEERRASVELLDTAYRLQIRALQLVWAMTNGEGSENLPLVMALPAATAPAPAAATAAPPPVARRGAWVLYEEVRKALAEVPQVFDRNDVCKALGYAPDRGSLYRVLQTLKDEGILALEQWGSGKTPSRYRKTGRSDAAAEE